MVNIKTIKKFEGKYITVTYGENSVVGDLTDIDPENETITVEWNEGFMIVHFSMIDGIELGKK